MTKKFESNDSATSTKRLEVIKQQLIATNSTPTTGPATTSPVPICLPNVPSNSTAMRPPTPPSSPSRKEPCTSTLSASTVHALPTVHYTVSQALSTKEGLSKHLHQKRTSFDNDTIQFVLDSCANVHIINDPEIFESISSTTTTGVATIGGDPLTPKGQGDCNIYISNDRGEKIPVQLLNALYFPDSPVNIISIAQLADSFEDNYKTKVSTARYHTDFQWDFGKHHRTIHHNFTRIPEIDVYPMSDGWKSFYNFSNYFE